ncbi:MAG: hypothetical protein GX793_02775 [Bacteroidales bacterium]|jgi:hypothetical protein|nr:hypothetical protein [Bacteroidales bacterium]
MKKLALILFCNVLLVMNIVNAQQNVGFGTTSPHASALLDMTATDKGLLIPRVTLLAINNGTAPVNNPATGLLVYNSAGSLEKGFYYWDGTQWVMEQEVLVSVQLLMEHIIVVEQAPEE